MRHQTVKFRSQSKHTNTYSIAFNDGILLYQTFQHGTCHVIIGTYNREVGHLEQAGHIVQAKIELMISNRTCIIPHLIHHLDFHLSFKQIIIGTSLRKITGIEQQHIFVLTALFFHKSRPTQHTRLSGQYRIREIRGKGFDTTMHVVRMKYIQFFHRLCGHHTHQQARQT